MELIPESKLYPSLSPYLSSSTLLTYSILVKTLFSRIRSKRMLSVFCIIATRIYISSPTSPNLGEAQIIMTLPTSPQHLNNQRTKMSSFLPNSWSFKEQISYLRKKQKTKLTLVRICIIFFISKYFIAIYLLSNRSC